MKLKHSRFAPTKNPWMVGRYGHEVPIIVNNNREAVFFVRYTSQSDQASDAHVSVLICNSYTYITGPCEPIFSFPGQTYFAPHELYLFTSHVIF